MASHVGYVYDRPVCFQVWLVSVAGLSGGGVLVLKQDKMENFSRQDGNSIAQDKSVTDKSQRSTTGWFP